MLPPVFIFVTDLTERDRDWPTALALIETLRQPLAAKLGFVPHLRLASLPHVRHARRERMQMECASHDHLADVLTAEAQTDRSDIFVLPIMLDFGLLQKAHLAEIIASIRHQFYQPSIVYDDVTPCHPLLVQAFIVTTWEG